MHRVGSLRPFARKTPRGTRIARWYCPQSHTTFSLLPDCLSARLPGTLDELETVVAHAERAPSLLAAANALRTDTVALPGAMRWVRRRVRRVHRVQARRSSTSVSYAIRCSCERASPEPERTGCADSLVASSMVKVSWR